MIESKKPVAWRWGIKKLNGSYEWRYSLNKTQSTSVPLYTRPSQRTWVGLTDEEIKTICSENGWDSSWQSLRFARAIEAKLKELNT